MTSDAIELDPSMRVWKSLVLALLLPALTAFAASHESVRGSHGVVASRSMIASEVGVDVMRSGGNAVDAVVATGFALAVTYPSAGNLGGGGFLVIRLTDGTLITNDNRERAPAKADRDMYLDENGAVVKGLSTASHLAVGVPGTVDGLLAVLDRYGTKSAKEVLAPAIALARDGFPLSADLARQFDRLRRRVAEYPASLAKFTRADGKSYQAGEIWKQPDLARTLERIARHGRDGFYTGKTAELIVAEMKRGGGLISMEDLESYRSRWREPVTGSYRGYEIVSMPPPSSGGVLLVHMLNMLEPSDVAGMGFGSAALMHRMVEAERRAYADRAEHLGDPDFYDVPLAMLLSKRYARERWADFDPDHASDSDDIGAGSWGEESMETTHVSVMDAAGNAVAYTTTLNLGFGSKIVAQGTGVLLNNEMDDFSVKPNTPNSFQLLGGVANEIQPGKRMLSSMTPTIVLENGEPLLVTGSPGGSTIITTVLQVVMNVVDHGMDLSDAVGKPRFHHQWKPDRIILEPFGFSPDTLELLRKLGHKNLSSRTFGRGIGDANSVMRVGDELHGMSDPRNDGGAAAF
jgi:gamma-glutamyltranspeptidase/glutathione hydrolase